MDKSGSHTVHRKQWADFIFHLANADLNSQGLPSAQQVLHVSGTALLLPGELRCCCTAACMAGPRGVCCSSCRLDATKPCAALPGRQAPHYWHLLLILPRPVAADTSGPLLLIPPVAAAAVPRGLQEVDICLRAQPHCLAGHQPGMSPAWLWSPQGVPASGGVLPLLPRDSLIWLRQHPAARCGPLQRRQDIAVDVTRDSL